MAIRRTSLVEAAEDARILKRIKEIHAAKSKRLRAELVSLGMDPKDTEAVKLRDLQMEVDIMRLRKETEAKDQRIIAQVEPRILDRIMWFIWEAGNDGVKSRAIMRKFTINRKALYPYLLFIKKAGWAEVRENADGLMVWMRREP